jgi:ferredoxin
MGMKGRERDAAKEAVWRERLQLWEQSQLQIPAFCERFGVPLAAFYRWRRIIVERDRGVPPGPTSPVELPVFALPQLDETRCTGCGDCVAICPVGCLVMDGPLPWLPRPADCVSCALCCASCPARAIKMGDQTGG